jgi:LCP family protein required for cell wall assembly
VRGETGGWTNGGFGLLRQTIFYNLGINVHYYAMVDLSGFKAIVDAVGGVSIAVDCAIQNLPLIGAEVPAAAVRVNDDGAYVLPVGYYHFNGAEALWYARARDNSSDFDRGRRQQQVLRAVWRQARDNGLLLNAPALWAEGSQYIQTNMAFEDLISLIPIALNLDPSRIEQFRFRRLYDTQPWQPPDGSFVQVPIYEHILEMLNDFYTPPTPNQIARANDRIRVLNGTTNENWDTVAAESLGWRGFAAFSAGGAAEPTERTILIDYTGSERGSNRQTIAAALNVRQENIHIQPDPNRTVDFEVIVGADYNACNETGILPVDPLPATN